jgi:hypothetical protein
MAVSDTIPELPPFRTASPLGRLRMYLFYMTAINPNPDTGVDARIAVGPRRAAAALGRR